MGIGKALIKELISNAKKLGFGAFLFFGRPEYYPQFGFVEAETFGVSDSEGYNYPSFMGMELIPGYLDCVKGGRFIESDIYNDDLNRDAVLMFDKSFSEEKYMRRCYELAIGAGKKGYDTFGAILVYDGKILEEAENTADYKKEFSDMPSSILFINVQISILMRYWKMPFCIPVVHLVRDVWEQSHHLACIM
jgi:hypothetical protein